VMPWEDFGKPKRWWFRGYLSKVGQRLDEDSCRQTSDSLWPEPGSTCLRPDPPTQALPSMIIQHP